MKISVITASFNGGQTLAHAIESVAAQTYSDKEHIIVDGGSTDNTPAIIAAHRAHLGCVILEPDKGMYDAMNKGLAVATGDVVGFLNSDDYYATSDVLTQVAHAFQNPNINAVYADLQYVDPNDTSRIVRHWRSCDFTPGMFMKGWCPAHPTFYIRKKVYEQYGGFDLQFKMGNDVEWMMRLMEKYQIKTQYIPNLWVCMRTGGASNRDWRNIVLQNREIIRASRQHQLPMRVLPFVWYKIWDRLSQRIQYRIVCRPERSRL